MSLYLYINIFTICTLLFSFDKRVRYYQYFPALLLAILITGCLFIPWDILFTQKGIWGFNKEYILGIYIQDLPLEEWLFFITVPFSCAFIHVVLKTKVKFKIPLKYSGIVWNTLSILLLILGLLSTSQYYTSLTFILCSIGLTVVNLFHKEFMRNYLLTYLFCLIPFMIVNSILTGSFTDAPVVWYNEAHIFGFRIGTIPIEDTIYNRLLLLMICFFTDYFYSFKR
jgi:lycopene cyclase domain-containing protein